LREARDASKETDGARYVERAAFEWNVIARRPKADVAIQSRRSRPSSPGLLPPGPKARGRNDERVLDLIAL